MAIIPIPAFTDNYIWAIVDEHTKVFDCIDPGEAEPVLKFAHSKQLHLRSILLTHHHQDHIGGVADLSKAIPACIIYGPDDARIPEVNRAVKEGQSIQVGLYSFQILSNPGHTSSHISYYEPNEAWLFCGDTLFSGGCGRVFDGTLNQLYQSMLLFKSLPPETKVFCAHEYTVQNLRFAQIVEPSNQFVDNYLNKAKKQGCTLPSTMEIEQLINPFLRTNQPEIQDYAQKHGATSKNPLEIFRVLREQKNLFS